MSVQQALLTFEPSLSLLSPQVLFRSMDLNYLLACSFGLVSWNFALVVVWFSLQSCWDCALGPYTYRQALYCWTTTRPVCQHQVLYKRVFWVFCLLEGQFGWMYRYWMTAPPLPPPSALGTCDSTLSRPFCFYACLCAVSREGMCKKTSHPLEQSCWQLWAAWHGHWDLSLVLLQEQYVLSTSQTLVQPLFWPLFQMRIQPPVASVLFFIACK